jgi:hypothetical protein
MEMSVTQLKLMRDRVESLYSELDRSIDLLDWRSQAGVVLQVRETRSRIERLLGEIRNALDDARRAAA